MRLSSESSRMFTPLRRESAPFDPLFFDHRAHLSFLTCNLHRYVDDLSSMDAGGSSSPFPSAIPPSNALVALVELDPPTANGKGKGKGKEREGEEVLFGLVSVVPSTGDVIFDEFTDSHMRKELEVRHSFTRAPIDARLTSPPTGVISDSDDAHPAAGAASAELETVKGDRKDAGYLHREEVSGPNNAFPTDGRPC